MTAPHQDHAAKLGETIRLAMLIADEQVRTEIRSNAVRAHAADDADDRADPTWWDVRPMLDLREVSPRHRGPERRRHHLRPPPWPAAAAPGAQPPAAHRPPLLKAPQ